MTEHDVTDEIEWRKVPRLLGKWKADEIWHGTIRIGYVEPMGPVLTDKRYGLRMKPSRNSILEQRIVRVDSDLEAKKAG